MAKKPCKPKPKELWEAKAVETIELSRKVPFYANPAQVLTPVIIK